MPQSLQLQITESFDISYLDNLEHKFIKKKHDNVQEGPDASDTGVKVTILYVVNDDLKADAEYGELTLYHGKNEEVRLKLKHNQMVILKSRKVGYSIDAKNRKVFVMAMKVGGPKAEGF